MKLLRDLKVYLLTSVVEPPEKAVLRLSLLQPFSSSPGHSFRQLSECRQSCGLWNGNTCSCEDNQPVISQGVQEKIGEINS